MIFLDTSICVASFAQDHPHYAASRPLLRDLRPESAAFAAHSLAEVYAALTRLPGSARAQPSVAREFLTTIMQRTTIVSLNPSEYLDAIDSISTRGLTGGIVYDALLLACARKINADRIYTWNQRHFRAIAPDLAERIVTPGV